MSADEKPIMDNKMKIDFPQYNEQAVRKVLRKNEQIWSSQRRDIKETEHLYKSQVANLGHMIKQGELAIHKKKIRSLKMAKTTPNKTQLIYFLSLCNIFRRFIQKWAEVAHPLNNPLKRDNRKPSRPKTRKNIPLIN